MGVYSHISSPIFVCAVINHYAPAPKPPLVPTPMTIPSAIEYNGVLVIFPISIPLWVLASLNSPNSDVMEPVVIQIEGMSGSRGSPKN